MYSLEHLEVATDTSVIFECLAGSRAYGTATATSDSDIRGIFAIPAKSYIALNRPPDQVADEHNNVVYFSLRRIIELLAEANPNILELLYMPADCVRRSSLEMQMLTAARDMFITKQCADSHVGYALSQIKKARGQNKWINNPKPEQPPRKEDYCHIVPRSQENADQPPSRPIALAKLNWDLGQYHAARLEHARDTFRLYHYGNEARGVFRGDVLACESIPESDEQPRFAGLLLFNEQGWRQALTDHNNYWNWRKDRNEARWQQQESGELDFDAKNMMHTVRLLLSGQSIVKHGKPIVRFHGQDLALLMDIRNGKLAFDKIMELAESIRADCELLKSQSTLPDSCDRSKANQLLSMITATWEQRCL